MYKHTQIYKMYINILRHGKRKRKREKQKNKKLNTEYDAS
jgi:hypothetical protein